MTEKRPVVYMRYPYYMLKAFPLTRLLKPLLKWHIYKSIKLDQSDNIFIFIIGLDRSTFYYISEIFKIFAFTGRGSQIQRCNPANQTCFSCQVGNPHILVIETEQNLKSRPLDLIKIDRSYIRRLGCIQNFAISDLYCYKADFIRKVRTEVNDVFVLSGNYRSRSFIYRLFNIIKERHLEDRTIVILNISDLDDLINTLESIYYVLDTLKLSFPILVSFDHKDLGDLIPLFSEFSRRMKKNPFGFPYFMSDGYAFNSELQLGLTSTFLYNLYRLPLNENLLEIKMCVNNDPFVLIRILYALNNLDDEPLTIRRNDLFTINIDQTEYYVLPNIHNLTVQPCFRDPNSFLMKASIDLYFIQKGNQELEKLIDSINDRLINLYEIVNHQGILEDNDRGVGHRLKRNFNRMKKETFRCINRYPCELRKRPTQTSDTTPNIRCFEKNLYEKLRDPNFRNAIHIVYGTIYACVRGTNVPHALLKTIATLSLKNPTKVEYDLPQHKIIDLFYVLTSECYNQCYTLLKLYARTVSKINTAPEPMMINTVLYKFTGITGTRNNQQRNIAESARFHNRLIKEYLEALNENMRRYHYTYQYFHREGTPYYILVKLESDYDIDKKYWVCDNKRCEIPRLYTRLIVSPLFWIHLSIYPDFEKDFIDKTTQAKDAFIYFYDVTFISDESYRYAKRALKHILNYSENQIEDILSIWEQTIGISAEISKITKNKLRIREIDAFLKIELGDIIKPIHQQLKQNPSYFDFEKEILTIIEKEDEYKDNLSMNVANILNSYRELARTIKKEGIEQDEKAILKAMILLDLILMKFAETKHYGLLSKIHILKDLPVQKESWIKIPHWVY